MQDALDFEFSSGDIGSVSGVVTTTRADGNLLRMDGRRFSRNGRLVLDTEGTEGIDHVAQLAVGLGPFATSSPRLGSKDPKRTHIGEVAAELLDCLGDLDSSRKCGVRKTGRTFAVLGSPAESTTALMAFGLSALSAGVGNPWDSHEAAAPTMIASGQSVAHSGDRDVPVDPGGVVMTESDAPHATAANGRQSLVALWWCAPPGCETRWLSGNALEELP